MTDSPVHSMSALTACAFLAILYASLQLLFIGILLKLTAGKEVRSNKDVDTDKLTKLDDLFKKDTTTPIGPMVPGKGILSVESSRSTLALHLSQHTSTQVLQATAKSCSAITSDLLEYQAASTHPAGQVSSASRCSVQETFISSVSPSALAVSTELKQKPTTCSALPNSGELMDSQEANYQNTLKMHDTRSYKPPAMLTTPKLAATLPYPQLTPPALSSRHEEPTKRFPFTSLLSSTKEPGDLATIPRLESWTAINERVLQSSSRVHNVLPAVVSTGKLAEIGSPRLNAITREGQDQSFPASRELSPLLVTQNVQVTGASHLHPDLYGQKNTPHKHKQEFSQSLAPKLGSTPRLLPRNAESDVDSDSTPAKRMNHRRLGPMGRKLRSTFIPVSPPAGKQACSRTLVSQATNHERRSSGGVQYQPRTPAKSKMVEETLELTGSLPSCSSLLSSPELTEENLLSPSGTASSPAESMTENNEDSPSIFSPPSSRASSSPSTPEDKAKVSDWIEQKNKAQAAFRIPETPMKTLPLPSPAISSALQKVLLHTDLYAILNLTPSCTLDEIQESFTLLSRNKHIQQPIDLPGLQECTSDEERLIITSLSGVSTTQMAYFILRDGDMRAAHDAGRRLRDVFEVYWKNVEEEREILEFEMRREYRRSARKAAESRRTRD